MAGFRTFATGEVLTAANVNDFLMKQSVMVFADAAARTTALGAEVAEGMLTYNEDTAQLEVFDGSAFVPAGAEPKIKNIYTANTTASQTGSVGAQSFIDVSGLSVTLVPESEDSKFLVFQTVYGSLSQTDGLLTRVLRDSTPVGQTTGSLTAAFFPMIIRFVDEPNTTSSITYKAQVTQNHSNAAQTVFIDRSVAAAATRSSSFLHIVEFE